MPSSSKPRPSTTNTSASTVARNPIASTSASTSQASINVSTAPIPRERERDRDRQPVKKLVPSDALARYLSIEDRRDRSFMAILAAFATVNNQALCVKELVDVVRDNQLLHLPGVTPSGTINSAIRNHINRCTERKSPCLLSRHVLSGDASDARLSPAIGVKPHHRQRAPPILSSTDDLPPTPSSALFPTSSSSTPFDPSPISPTSPSSFSVPTTPISSQPSDSAEAAQEKVYLKNKNGRTRKGVCLWYLSPWTGFTNPFVREGFENIPFLTDGKEMNEGEVYLTENDFEFKWGIFSGNGSGPVAPAFAGTSAPRITIPTGTKVGMGTGMITPISSSASLGGTAKKDKRERDETTTAASSSSSGAALTAPVASASILAKESAITSTLPTPTGPSGFFAAPTPVPSLPVKVRQRKTATEPKPKRERVRKDRVRKDRVRRDRSRKGKRKTGANANANASSAQALASSPLKNKIIPSTPTSPAAPAPTQLDASLPTGNEKPVPTPVLPLSPASTAPSTLDASDVEMEMDSDMEMSSVMSLPDSDEDSSSDEDSDSDSSSNDDDEDADARSETFTSIEDDEHDHFNESRWEAVSEVDEDARIFDADESDSEDDEHEQAGMVMMLPRSGLTAPAPSPMKARNVEQPLPRWGGNLPTSLPVPGTGGASVPMGMQLSVGLPTTRERRPPSLFLSMPDREVHNRSELEVDVGGVDVDSRSPLLQMEDIHMDLGVSVSVPMDLTVSVGVGTGVVAHADSDLNAQNGDERRAAEDDIMIDELLAGPEGALHEFEEAWGDSEEDSRAGSVPLTFDISAVNRRIEQITPMRPRAIPIPSSHHRFTSPSPDVPSTPTGISAEAAASGTGTPGRSYCPGICVPMHRPSIFESSSENEASASDQARITVSVLPSTPPRTPSPFSDFRFHAPTPQAELDALIVAGASVSESPSPSALLLPTEELVSIPAPEQIISSPVVATVAPGDVNLVGVDAKMEPLPLGPVELGRIVIHTTQPSFPPICATFVDSFFVYVLTYPATGQRLLRAVDSDYVHLGSLILLSKPPLSPSDAVRIMSLCHNPQVIPPTYSSTSAGVTTLAGTWVPLEDARQLCASGELNIPLEVGEMFLENDLGELYFPEPLPEMCKARRRMQNQAQAQNQAAAAVTAASLLGMGGLAVAGTNVSAIAALAGLVRMGMNMNMSMNLESSVPIASSNSSSPTHSSIQHHHHHHHHVAPIQVPSLASINMPAMNLSTPSAHLEEQPVPLSPAMSTFSSVSLSSSSHFIGGGASARSLSTSAPSLVRSLSTTSISTLSSDLSSPPATPPPVEMGDGASVGNNSLKRRGPGRPRKSEDGALASRRSRVRHVASAAPLTTRSERASTRNLRSSIGGPTA